MNGKLGGEGECGKFGAITEGGVFKTITCANKSLTPKTSTIQSELLRIISEKGAARPPPVRRFSGFRPRLATLGAAIRGPGGVARELNIGMLHGSRECWVTTRIHYKLIQQKKLKSVGVLLIILRYFIPIGVIHFSFRNRLILHTIHRRRNRRALLRSHAQRRPNSVQRLAPRTALIHNNSLNLQPVRLRRITGNSRNSLN